MYQYFEVTKEDHIAVVTMLVQAMPMSFPEEFLRMLSDLEEDEQVRVILFKNDGRFFCSGGDLSSEGTAMTPIRFRNWLRRLNDSMQKLYTIPKPTIALVNGAASGGGCGLALSFDFIIASEKALFREVSVNVNTLPDTGGIWALMRHVGAQKAKELCMLGDKISAQEAQELGLLTKLVPSEQILEEGMTFARRLAEKPPAALAAIKSLINQMPDLNYSAYRSIEETTMATLSSMKDGKEGITAFFEKRKPHFTGE